MRNVRIIICPYWFVNAAFCTSKRPTAGGGGDMYHIIPKE